MLGEVGISTRVTAFCGTSSLQWSELVLFTQISSSTLTTALHQGLSVERFTGIFDYMWVFMTKENSWMKESIILEGTKRSSKALYGFRIDNLALRVLNSSRGFNATDARDHIFAFLGHPSLENIITPNYALSVEETYETFGVNFIKSTGSLDILCFVDNNETDLQSNLPSWTPRWHRPIIYPKEIHPGWECLKQDPTESIMFFHDQSLTVKALVVDRIMAHSSQIKLEHFEKAVVDAPTDRDTQHIVEQLWEMYTDGREASQLGDSLRVGKAFVWTLVFGSYIQQDWLQVDFLTYCRKHCGENFYRRLLREPYFASALENGRK